MNEIIRRVLIDTGSTQGQVCYWVFSIAPPLRLQFRNKKEKRGMGPCGSSCFSKYLFFHVMWSIVQRCGLNYELWSHVFFEKKCYCNKVVAKLINGLRA